MSVPVPQISNLIPCRCCGRMTPYNYRRLCGLHSLAITERDRRHLRDAKVACVVKEKHEREACPLQAAVEEVAERLKRRVQQADCN